MRKRKDRIEQWRAERRLKLGIDKAMQQSVAQAARVKTKRNKRCQRPFLSLIVQGKTWSLEDEGDDEEEETHTTQPASSGTELKREVAAARETIMATQTDKRREAMERAAEAAALASAALTVSNQTEEDEEDPLDKYMTEISKEVKSSRINTGKIITSKSNSNIAGSANIVKQEPTPAVSKSAVIKVITKTVKNEVIDYRFQMKF